MPAERFVLDVSVAVEWFLPSSGSRGKYAEEILERISVGELIPTVPDLWHYEIGDRSTAARPEDGGLGEAEAGGLGKRQDPLIVIAALAALAFGVEAMAIGRPPTK